jgi:S-adenosylmethionine/arginine decarboxylase-like enzyme
MTWWGQDLAIDAGECNPSLIRDAEHIKAFARDLVTAIKMKAFGEPIVVHFGTDGKMGYTLIQLIETSNISCHFAEDSNSLFLNCFSCLPFDKQVVKQVVEKYFEPKTVLMNMIERVIP